MAEKAHHGAARTVVTTRVQSLTNSPTDLLLSMRSVANLIGRLLKDAHNLRARIVSEDHEEFGTSFGLRNPIAETPVKSGVAVGIRLPCVDSPRRGLSNSE